MMIIDSQIVLVGSTNWSHFSLDKNHEANILINSKELAKEYEKYFEEIWKES
jgi:phosphatidylserine/phosphatidylglycerophosphate/cardiolipin synthase-like enzyme